MSLRTVPASGRSIARAGLLAGLLAIGIVSWSSSIRAAFETDFTRRELPSYREAKMSTERIRELNDAFRTTFSGGKVVMTDTVYELPDCVRAKLL